MVHQAREPIKVVNLMAIKEKVVILPAPIKVQETTNPYGHGNVMKNQALHVQIDIQTINQPATVPTEVAKQTKGKVKVPDQPAPTKVAGMSGPPDPGSATRKLLHPVNRVFPMINQPGTAPTEVAMLTKGKAKVPDHPALTKAVVMSGHPNPGSAMRSHLHPVNRVFPMINRPETALTEVAELTKDKVKVLGHPAPTKEIVMNGPPGPGSVTRSHPSLANHVFPMTNQPETALTEVAKLTKDMVKIRKLHDHIEEARMTNQQGHAGGKKNQAPRAKDVILKVNLVDIKGISQR